MLDLLNPWPLTVMALAVAVVVCVAAVVGSDFARDRRAERARAERARAERARAERARAERARAAALAAREARMTEHLTAERADDGWTLLAHAAHADTYAALTAAFGDTS